MSTRRKIIAGNWKMNKTVGEALDLVHELRGMVSMIRDRVEVVVAPPFTALHPVAKALEDSNIALAAQHCSMEPSGAFTGEVSAAMLEEVGCRYVIVGHSERRHLFGETDEMVNHRAHAVVHERMTPIICMGETLEEREANRTFEVVGRQLRGALSGFQSEKAAQFVLAYEPVWAIGTGRTATATQAQEVHAFIRELLIETFDRPTAERIRIQYGGSVKPGNARELLAEPDIDGALVGGASLKAQDFAAIVRAGA